MTKRSVLFYLSEFFLEPQSLVAYEEKLISTWRIQNKCNQNRAKSLRPESNGKTKTMQKRKTGKTKTTKQKYRYIFTFQKDSTTKNIKNISHNLKSFGNGFHLFALVWNYSFVVAMTSNCFHIYIFWDEFDKRAPSKAHELIRCVARMVQWWTLRISVQTDDELHKSFASCFFAALFFFLWSGKYSILKLPISKTNAPGALKFFPKTKKKCATKNILFGRLGEFCLRR